MKITETIKKYNLKKITTDIFGESIYYDLYQNRQETETDIIYYCLENKMSIDSDNGKTFFLTVQKISKTQFNKNGTPKISVHTTKIVNTDTITDTELKKYKIVKNKVFNNGDDFSAIVKHLRRPYIKITAEQYNRLIDQATKYNSDFVINNGQLFTFGSADGGFALMPYMEGNNEIK